jgi:hypothetical protein
MATIVGLNDEFLAEATGDTNRNFEEDLILIRIAAMRQVDAPWPETRAHILTTLGGWCSVHCWRPGHAEELMLITGMDAPA